MSNKNIRHNAKINDIDYKIVESPDKFIVVKSISNITPSSASGAHICFNTGDHHFDNFNSEKPLYINKTYPISDTIYINSGNYILPFRENGDNVILIPHKPISVINYSNDGGNLNLSLNTSGKVSIIVKNKETIEEIKEKIKDSNNQVLK